MALILFTKTIRTTRITPKLSMQTAFMHYRDLIGKREIVGFGFNGQPSYIDRSEFPFPAIRWREPSKEIEELRKKEKGDWRKMNICEKKTLYRASFCQTYAEFLSPTGEWKSVIGAACFFLSFAIWFFYWQKAVVFPPLPKTFKQRYRRAQFRRMLDIRANPIRGLAANWDYENDNWKR
ncbi:unnamed protein product [Psylliodes chrysocephalus]|uniref:Cytochrome c oxidase subunit 4 n=1 Tax=Psylliodes chrysocephalus TaxID=3402493 RepID=A0A9P0D1C5_9CUCU|nr:unnamed protein product [Psylliodes chrysocephala]